MADIFRDRREAGRLLAGALMQYANQPGVIVLGLPRGGVPVAFEVALALSAPLDVFVVRKLGTPGNPELAMGAIASGGVRILNEDTVSRLAIPMEVIDAATDEEERELHRREIAYRGVEAEPEVCGKTVLLIDDGIATGSTMRAAIRALFARHPARLIVAAPVAAASTCRAILPRHRQDRPGIWQEPHSAVTGSGAAWIAIKPATGRADSTARIATFETPAHITMLAKYKIEYAVPFQRHTHPHYHLTNDPVACEEFLTELLERGFKITTILHEGVALPDVDFDRMIRTAAGMLASKHICQTLGIDRAEAHHRFGVPA